MPHCMARSSYCVLRQAKVCPCPSLLSFKTSSPRTKTAKLFPMELALLVLSCLHPSFTAPQAFASNTCHILSPPSFLLSTQGPMVVMDNGRGSFEAAFLNSWNVVLVNPCELGGQSGPQDIGARSARRRCMRCWCCLLAEV
ncbi:hypothetical protein IQ06DRAFT_119659 [Phaeosphaeriaceae sp. SRC1lsM3a]|nr:hypothetical protein IQ06DRAFT_119659 [Stagonospora sp. SRC1lsM3a]